MLETLIIYSTTDGQTIKICDKLVKDCFNNNAKLCSLKDVIEEDLNSYNKIIIGASIRYGKHNPNVLKFVKRNIHILNKVKSAFFSVNVVARKKEKNTPSTNPYVVKFIKQTNWKPTNIGVLLVKLITLHISLLISTLLDLSCGLQKALQIFLKAMNSQTGMR